MPFSSALEAIDSSRSLLPDQPARGNESQQFCVMLIQPLSSQSDWVKAHPVPAQSNWNWLDPAILQATQKLPTTTVGFDMVFK